MQQPEWDSESPTHEEEVALPKSSEERVDQFGKRTALFALVVAFFIAAIWLISRPSFDKCSAVENVTQRNVCYDALRNDLSKPPAKGPDIPKAPQ